MKDSEVYNAIESYAEKIYWLPFEKKREELIKLLTLYWKPVKWWDANLENWLIDMWEFAYYPYLSRETVRKRKMSERDENNLLLAFNDGEFRNITHQFGTMLGIIESGIGQKLIEEVVQP